MYAEWTKKCMTMTCALFILCTHLLSAETAAGYPNLTITEEVSSGSEIGKNIVVQPGDSATFTVTITNSGDAPAEDVLLISELPKGLGFIEQSMNREDPGNLSPPISMGLYGERILACHGFSVPAKAQTPTTFTYTVYVDAPPPKGAQRFVHSSNVVYFGDPALSKGTSPIVKTSNGVCLKLKTPDYTPFPVLRITDQVTTQSGTSNKEVHAKFGETVTVTMQITNVGNEAAIGSGLMIPLPAGLSFVPNSFLVNGTPEQAIDDPGMLIYNIVSNLEFNKPMTICFQATVNVHPLADLPIFSILSYIGNPNSEGSSTNSNMVHIIVEP